MAHEIAQVLVRVLRFVRSRHFPDNCPHPPSRRDRPPQAPPAPRHLVRYPAGRRGRPRRRPVGAASGHRSPQRSCDHLTPTWSCLPGCTQRPSSSPSLPASTRTANSAISLSELHSFFHSPTTVSCVRSCLGNKPAPGSNVSHRDHPGPFRQATPPSTSSPPATTGAAGEIVPARDRARSASAWNSSCVNSADAAPGHLCLPVDESQRSRRPPPASERRLKCIATHAQGRCGPNHSHVHLLRSACVVVVYLRTHLTDAGILLRTFSTKPTRTRRRPAVTSAPACSTLPLCTCGRSQVAYDES